MIKFYPLKSKARCLWCDNRAHIYVFDTEKQPAPICQTHYEFFTEPLAWNSWKERKEYAQARSMKVDNFLQASKNNSI